MDYTALKTGTIIPLIEKYGKAVTLRSPGTSTGYTKTWNAGESRYQWENNTTHEIVYVDPATTPTDVAGYAVESKYHLDQIDNVNILASDRRFKTASFTSPKPNKDVLIVGTTQLNIVNVFPVSPGSVDLVYELQCRA